LGSGLLVAVLGVAAILASHRISIYIRHAVDPGWSGSLTWRAALLLTGAALLLSAGGHHRHPARVPRPNNGTPESGEVTEES
jgi:hypothetical protein